MTDFPPYLLEASDEERLRYFYQVHVPHPRADALQRDLDIYSNPMLGRSLILFIGCTGVGKSNMIRRFTHAKNMAASHGPDHRPECVAAIAMEAEAPDKGGFCFSSIYSEALRQMNSPLVERTRPVATLPLREQRAEVIDAGRTDARESTKEALKKRFRRNLEQRQVEVLCLDEAINVFKIGVTRSLLDRKQQLADQGNQLKTLVNKTATALVLAGSYDFFDLTTCTGQLARRTLILHLEPYDKSPHDTAAFLDAYLSLLRHLPIPHDLADPIFITEIFLQSLGCIGILRDILLSSLRRALVERKRLTPGIVRLHYFPRSQLERMRLEYEEGSKNLRDFMSLEELASAEDQRSSQPSTVKKLKPGETKPSHRHLSAKEWEQ